MPATILLIEDEADLSAAVQYSLEREGWRVVAARDGAAGLALARTERPELILLDLMLPGLSGTEVCRELKSSEETRRIPVVMVTARAEEIDRVVGFELGAEDYVTKPFSMRELVLRAKALLRRVQSTDAPEGLVRFGRLLVDGGAHRVWVDDAEIVLTALEFRLLSTLLARRGRVQTREALLEDVWGITADVTTRTVDTHVKRLRQKLGAGGDYVETLRGVGYRFRAEPDA